MSIKLFYDTRSTTKSGQFMNRAVATLMTAVVDSNSTEDVRASLMTTVGGDPLLVLDADRPVASEALGISVVVQDIQARKGELESCSLTVTSSSEPTRRSTRDLLAFVREISSTSISSSSPTAVRYIYDSRPCASAAGQRSREFVNQTPDHLSRIQRIVSAPRALSFQRHLFQSTKTFENLCGDDVRELRKRVGFFLRNREWYARKGVPYQLGIMLSGECGTGKSSAIRAIANATSRSIVNINLTNIATTGQLKRLFLSDTLNVFENDDQTEPTVVTLPIDDRIFVLDEVDAVGASIVSRPSAASTQSTRQTMPTQPTQPTPIPDELTLGDLLNIFDGGVEVPGRIIVMLSNHWERLDPALVRPGRIDIHIKFSLCGERDLAELYSMYFGDDSSEDPSDKDELVRIFSSVPVGVLSPAEVSDVMISAAAAAASSSSRPAASEICEVLRAAALSKHQTTR